MMTIIDCPFCNKKLTVEQEDHDSYIIVCNFLPCTDFYLNQHVIAGQTPEEALSKLDEFLGEFNTGKPLWVVK